MPESTSAEDSRERLVFFNVVFDKSLVELNANQEAFTSAMGSVLSKNKKLQVLPQSTRDTLLKQRGFNLADCSKGECRFAMAKGLVGMKLMLESTVSRFGDGCRVAMRVQRIKTGNLESDHFVDVPCKHAQVDQALRGLADIVWPPGKKPSESKLLARLTNSSGGQARLESVPEIEDFKAPSVGLEGDIAVLVAYDAALKADKNGKADPGVALKAWEAVAALGGKNPYQKQAKERAAQWKTYADRVNARVAREKADRDRLLQLLPLTVVSVDDKRTQIQRYISAYGELDEEIQNKVPGGLRGEFGLTAGSAELVRIPAGWFWRGCELTESDRRLGINESCLNGSSPMRRIYLSEFFIDKHEVTVSDYSACVAAGACGTKHLDSQENCTFGKPGKERHPINCVGWEDADAYCKWAGKRLPTEAEWEKAARGRDKRRFVWGDEKPRMAVANYVSAYGYSDDFLATAPVCSFPSAAFPNRLCDMAGNVSEWTLDWFDEQFYANSDERNPVSKNETQYYGRVHKGGSFKSYISSQEVAYREGKYKNFTSESIGFRCAK